MKLVLHPRPAIRSPLLQFQRNVTSQCGEDGIIARLIDVIRPNNQYCIEFGAWDGVKHSNCYNLLFHNNWHGLLIEANADKYSALLQTYSAHSNVTTINTFVEFDGQNSLDNILRRCGAPAHPALLSVDIDGNDYYVWESLEEFRPVIVVIEFNPSIPNDVEFVQDKSFEVNQGCSLRALVSLAKQKGYELAVCTNWNAIFLTQETFPAVGVGDNSIDRLYTPVQDGRIFHGYDGSIHVVGMDRLLWHDVPLGEADFQVLPKSMRVFGDAQRR